MTSMKLPSNIVPPLLAQVPSNLFETRSRKVAPDNASPNGDVYPATRANTVTFSIGASPDEYVDGTNSWLCFTAHATIKLVGTYNGPGRLPPAAVPAVAPTQGDKDKEAAAVLGMLQDPDQSADGVPRWRYGALVESVNESVNVGGIQLNSFTDKGIIHAIHALRAYLTRSGVDLSEDQIDELISINCSAKSNKSGFTVVYTSALDDDGNATPIERTIPSDGLKIRIPMSMISDVFRCTSLVPLGMFSNFSVSAIKFKCVLPIITIGTDANAVIQSKFYGRYGITGVDTTLVDSDNNGYHGVHLDLAIVKNNSASFQERMLGLFQQSTSQSIGGVTVPLGLRLNTIHYTPYGPFSLQKNQPKLHLKLPSTNPSVRALAYIVFRSDNFDSHYTDPGFEYFDADPPNGKLQNRGVVNGQLRVTSIEINYGTRSLTNNCVRDSSAYDRVVDDWLVMNEKKSGHVFSCQPYWRELGRAGECQAEKRHQFQGAIPKIGRAGCHSVCYGVASFENSNHEGRSEEDASEACGVNLSQVGSVDVVMGFSNVASDGVGGLQMKPGAAIEDYEVVFLLASDEVLEVSPSGVREISAETLNY